MGKYFRLQFFRRLFSSQTVRLCAFLAQTGVKNEEMQLGFFSMQVEVRVYLEKSEHQ